MSGRVLVTGVTGFVGRAVVAPLIELGFEVHGVGRQVSAGQGYQPHVADLLDAGGHGRLLRAIAPSHVLHLAWYVEPQQFWTSPQNAVWRDVTLRFGEAAFASGVTRFVGVGTCAEYAPADPPGTSLSEDAPLGPSTLYGQAKLDCSRGLAQLFAVTPIQFAWARLFHLTGPGEAEARLIPAVRVARARGERFRLAAPHAVRDLGETTVIGRQLARLVASSVIGPINLATGQGRTVAAIAAEAAGGREWLDASADGGRGDVIVADIARARAAGLV